MEATMKIQYRPGWKIIFKEYGGFENWKQAKIVSLEKAGKLRLAEWYKTATVLQIGQRDGQITSKR
jgi:hypothetical protein